MTESFDCIVIGSGPGGYVAAIRAAQLGMHTAIVEKEDQVGGRCLHFACIPAKTVLRSADLLAELMKARQLGIEVGEPKVNFSELSANRSQVIGTLASGVLHLLKRNRITLIAGEGSIESDRSVRVDGQRFQAARAIILATGSVRQPLPGISFGGRVIGTEEAWLLERLPNSLAVVGAGASGAEVASAYARLGSSVRLFETADRVLPTEDSDISRWVLPRFADQGIDVRTATKVFDVQTEDDQVRFCHGTVHEVAEWLVVATGRVPDASAIGTLGAMELTERGHIKVNAHQQTSVAHVYAIGDLTSGPALAHKASIEGILAAEHAAGMNAEALNQQNIPRATFCQPNVASFGLTEDAAREAGYDVVIGRANYGSVGAGVVQGAEGMVKIVGDRRYGEILGGHIAGTRAVDLIQELVNAQRFEGGFPELARTIHGHPTLSEAIAEAARAADGWMIH